MGAPGVAERDLSAGEWHVLRVLGDGATQSTADVIELTRLYSADDMLRELRRRALVQSAYVKGGGHWLYWSITDLGHGVIHDRNARLMILERLESHLEPRLGSVGLAYALRLARWRLGLTYDEPRRPGYSRPQVWQLIEQMVRAGVDMATTGR